MSTKATERSAEPSPTEERHHSPDPARSQPEDGDSTREDKEGGPHTSKPTTERKDSAVDHDKGRNHDERSHDWTGSIADRNCGRTNPSQSPEREGGIGCRKEPSFREKEPSTSSEKRASAATKGNSDVPRTAPEAVCRSHDGDPSEALSQKESSSQEEPFSQEETSDSKTSRDETSCSAAWLQESVPVPKLALKALERRLEDLTQSAKQVGEEFRHRAALQWLVAHVFHCQTLMRRRYETGVPVSHKLLKEICREVGDPVPTCTGDIWRWAEREGILRIREYAAPSSGGTPSGGASSGGGKSREFLLTEAALKSLMDGVKKGCRYKTRYDLTNGKRVQRRWRTRLTYDGRHSWKERSPLIYKTLKALKGQCDLVNKAAVEAHLAELEEKAETAYVRYKEAYAKLRAEQAPVGRRLSRPSQENPPERGLSACGVTVCKRSRVRERIRELVKRVEAARRAALAAYREMRRVEARYHQDLRIWVDIVSQGLEKAENMPEGIFQYETAYEVQVASGRLTMKCGLQNASKEMKAAAAAGIPGYINVDIKSCQTEGLIGEMKRAAEAGVDLDISILVDYTRNDGKDGLADRYGIDRELWKRPEHAIKFGAGFHYGTVEKALSAARRKVSARISGRGGKLHYGRLHRFRHETRQEAYRRAVRRQLPTMAAIALDWAEDPDIAYDDPERIYEILKEAYGEMATEIDKWLSWLAGEHWSRASKAGGKGRHVRNPCQIPFSIWDSRLKEVQPNGERVITRRNQKVAYATSRLQGLEAAYMHHLALLAEEAGYQFLRNEHDGAVLLVSRDKVPEDNASGNSPVGTSPETDLAHLLGGAPAEATRRSRFRRAHLEVKPFSSGGASQEGPATRERSGMRASKGADERAVERPTELSLKGGRTAEAESSQENSDLGEKVEAAASRIWSPPRLPPSCLF